MSSEDKERGRFPFLEVYEEETENLDPESELAFRRAVSRYGLYKETPDFSNQKNRLLCELAWRHVFKWLDRSWTYRENGLKGGAPRGNQNARKTPKKGKDKTTGNKQ